MKILVHRPARLTEPVAAPAAEPIAPPPNLPDSPTGGVPIQALLPILGSVSSMLMMVVMRGSNPIFMVVGALVMVVALTSGLAMAFTQRARATRTRQLSRDRYLDYLEDLRATQREAAVAARAAALTTDPDPVFLPQVIADPARVWERRPDDADFLRLRLGRGNVRWFGLTAPVDKNPVQPLDPLMLDEAVQVGQTYSTVEDMPIWCDLAAGGDVALIGKREETTNAARALIAQLAVFHSPDDVRLAAVFDPDRAAEWAGLNLLPHSFATVTPTGVPRALVAPNVQDLTTMLAGDLTSRIRRVAARRHSGTPGTRSTGLQHLVVILDEHSVPASSLPIPEGGYSCADLAITVVHLIDDRLDEPADLGVRVTLDDGTVLVERVLPPGQRDAAEHGAPATGWVDRVSPVLLEAIARDVAPLTFATRQSGVSVTSVDTVSAMKLLGIRDGSLLEPKTAWKPRTGRDFLRVPIGVDDHGAPLLLDLKESAQLGMGPHGICVGATGSGKSELLRTLVLSLALTHSPEDLSMILVDYKGGAAFAPFAQLAHVAGLIDNLADDAQLTRRARESIEGEVLRRQEMLKQANSAASINHYRKMREENPTLPPMPHLLLVIDEFGELLTAEPEFSPLLLKIGRIGRSIGVHLLLASQRIEGGMLHGLDTYLSYWIGMRTFSEAESRTILNTPDAFTLPAIPGFGYLKVDTSVYTRFRSGYVSGPVEEKPSAEEDETMDDRALVQLVPLFDVPEVVETGVEEQPELPDVGNLLVDEAVARLATPMAAKPVWLPPLSSRITLGTVLTDETVRQSRAGLIAPMGLLDDPAHQQQGAWLLDLGARGGHVAVVGAPQSGRSTFLRTVAVALALTHTPKQVSIYGIDLTGGGLDRIEGFPHVGGVATRADRARVTRLFEELQAMIVMRENVFRNHRIDSVAALRAAHAKGLITELVAPDVVILVDGVEPIRNEFDELDAPFTALLQRGGTFGIHVVMALTRWNELRSNAQPLIGQHFELRINDPGESSIQRAAAQVLKSARPGRVLTQDLLYAQVALPVLDDVEDDADIGNAMVAIADRSAQAWSGPSATPIRLLPDVLDPTELPDELAMPDAIPFGLRQDTFAAVAFDPLVDQHLLVFGDPPCGKTTLLRGLAQEFIRRYTPEELVIAVIDPRQGLASSVPDEYLGGQATGAKDARLLCAAIAAELDKRTGDKESFYPRVVVLVDDYDIVAAGGTQPLAPLLPYVPSARDLKLSVILTRPVAGSGRALFDNAIQALRDTGGSGLVMNGERAEGAVYPKVYAEQMPSGRGRFIRRGMPPRLVQVAAFGLGVEYDAAATAASGT